MRFSRLRLLGFKSFVEPCEFVIERGLTGIVGPNGCGKSNLVEALRWVMGESSYKNMRASGMDDVIFSGSATRPSRNTAEVTLFLDNSDRSAPAVFNDADELQVSRRIEREAGSVYRINGKEARARDVQLLFADQSTGARSPSMVGQGRIGELIQARPQARRALLEEAAGISGLHTRRHEAELRLRAAEQNLERLDDVVGELEGQIESLKRQARQASRFRNISAEIRKTEAALLHLRWTAAKTQTAEAKSALTAATMLVAQEAQAQMNAAKEQAIGAHRLPELREAEAVTAATLQRLTIARSQIDEEAGRVRSRQIELDKRIGQLDADVRREEQMLHDNAGILERLGAEEAELEAENGDADGREAMMRAAFEDAAEKLTASENTLSTLTAQRAEAAAARQQYERVVRDCAERRDRLERQLVEVSREMAELSAKISAMADPLVMRDQVEHAAEMLETAEAAVIAAEKQVTDARLAEQELRSPLQEARAELARIETEAQTLGKILNSMSVGAFPAVLEQMKVERGFETALGAALGEDLDLPLAPQASAYWRGIAPEAGDPALPQGVLPLIEVVNAPPQLARRLAQIGIVEAEDGGRLQKLLKPGQRLVSREGDFWRWDGMVAGADAPTAAVQRLVQKNRLAELEAEAAVAAQRVETAAGALGTAEAHVGKSVEAERDARLAARNARHVLETARESLAQAEKTTGEMSARRAGLEETHARLEEGRGEIDAGAQEAMEGLGNAPDLDGLQSQLDRVAAEVSRDRAGLSEARAIYEGLRRESEARERRLVAIAAERRNWTMRAENASQQIAALVARRTEATDERVALAEAPDDIENRRRALMSEIAATGERRQAAADRLQEAENRQREADKAATDAIQSLAQAREARARAEERLSAADERRKEIEARIHEVLNVAPHLAFKLAGLEEDGPAPDAGDIENRLERLKIERERLGAVNLRAEEEQKELCERHDSIVSEREDVVEAIHKLRYAIQSLNREGRERLLAAFDVVNSQFQRLFTHLFGGGMAELQLIESEDPLNAGLEILARPPGKKPQTMTLLSGGEQALTAMALIFAVFLTNPAPICVLDEVDAPLDDHNVERYCNLMDEMAATTETRFVIITHNPITMARMNRLFGVTMAEQGVSQIVSVDLQTAEQLREAG